MRFRIFQILVVLLLLFQIQDGYCTYIGIERFGTAVEANPIIVFLIEVIGLFWGVWIPKILALSFLAFIYKSNGRTVHMALLIVMLFLNSFYAWAAANWINVLLFSM